MKLVRHYRAQAEGCRKHAQRVKNESLRKRYAALADAYLALAAEREKFLEGMHETETTSVDAPDGQPPLTHDSRGAECVKSDHASFADVGHKLSQV